MTPRTRTETVTIGGKTHTVGIPADTPRAPVDWDRWLSTGLTAGTAAVVAGALAWSVVAIGDLLGEQAPAALAYAVAGVFDMAWILCMGFEYQLRYRPSRQGLPRVMGWILLTVSVGAIFAHGLRVADAVVATVGALVAVLAKTLWHVRMRIGRRDLNAATQGWLDAELDDVAAVGAVIGARRQITRAQARACAEFDSLAPVQHEVHTGASGLHLVHPGSTPDLPPPGARRAALHALLDGLPDGDTRSISDLARDLGEEVGLRFGPARNAVSAWRQANNKEEAAR